MKFWKWKKDAKPIEDKSHDYVMETIVCNTVDELDQALHDLTLRQMAADKDGTLRPNIKIMVHEDVYKKCGDNLFNMVMMKAMTRSIIQTASHKDNLYYEEFPSKSSDNKEDNIISLFKDEKATYH